MKHASIVQCLLAALVALATPQDALAADTIRIAHIDPMSGPFAAGGTALGRHTQAAVEEINAKGGVLGGAKLEIVLFDGKANPQESSLALKQAIDQGIRLHGRPCLPCFGSRLPHYLRRGARVPPRLQLNRGDR